MEAADTLCLSGQDVVLSHDVEHICLEVTGIGRNTSEAHCDDWQNHVLWFTPSAGRQDLPFNREEVLKHRRQYEDRYGDTQHGDKHNQIVRPLVLV